MLHDALMVPTDCGSSLAAVVGVHRDFDLSIVHEAVGFGFFWELRFELLRKSPHSFEVHFANGRHGQDGVQQFGIFVTDDYISPCFVIKG